MHLIQLTAHARPHFDGFRRFKSADVFIPFDNVPGSGLNDGDGGRGRRLLSVLSTTHEQQANREGGECEQANCSHGFHSLACACASTNQSNLSTPREISVNKSAVSASPALAAV